MLDYEYVTSADRLAHIANEAAGAAAIALDLETTPKPEWRHIDTAAFSPHLGRIRLCSINTGKRVYVIDLFQTGGLGPVARMLHNPNAETGAGHPVVVGQNLKFDQTYLLDIGIELWPVFDSFRASAMLYNGKGKGNRGIGHNLYDIMARELGQGPEAQDLGGSDWGGALTKEQLDYAAEDVTYLLPIREHLRAKMEKAGLFKIALLEFGAILPEAAVELNGFPFDPQAWMKVAESNRIKAVELSRYLLKALPNPRGQLLLPGASDWLFDIKALEAWAHRSVTDDEGNVTYEEYTPEEKAQLARARKPKGKKDKTQFNLDSTDQMLQSLHRLGGDLKLLEDTKETSLALFAQTNPVISKLLEYRGFATKLKSFGPDYLEYINPVTQRIHASYFPMLVTGRYGAQKPNLGQIPRDKEYRKCFKAPPGTKLCLNDYAGIEMRLAAEESGDPTLLRLFKEDLDPHRYTASKLLQKLESEITKEERQQAKPCIAEGQLVLTDHGLKPIELVELTDRLWDGMEWVTHGGVIYKGYKEVLTYDGLTATPDHNVWLQTGEQVPLRDAASAGGVGRLAVGGNGEVPVRFVGLDRDGRSLGEEGREGRRVSLLGVHEPLLDLPFERPYGEDHQLSVPASREVWPGPEGPHPRGAVRRDRAALQHADERHLPELRWARHQAALRLEGALHPLDVGAPSASLVQGHPDRSAGEQRALRAGQPPARHAAGEPAEHAREPLRGVRWEADAHHARLARPEDPAPGVSVRTGLHAGPHRERSEPGPSAVAEAVSWVKVYDICDAGPRNRFTVSGKVASNCNFGFLYGMQAEKFVLYALTGYGVKLTLQQARQYRQRFFDEYKGLASWHERALRKGKSTRMATTPFGRLRYFDEEAHNEYLNHPIQAAGADGLKMALRETYFRAKKYDGKVKMVHHVHDEIITQVVDDAELIKVWLKDKQEGMVNAMSRILRRVPVAADPSCGLTWADKS
jgi:DNA polymerase I